MALLHTNPMLGRDSAYQAECVQRFPDRLRSMTHVDEWRIRDEIEAVIDEVTTAITVHGLHAIKFNPLTYIVSPDPWDDGVYQPFWEAVTSLNVPIFFTLGSGPKAEQYTLSDTEQQEGYLNELRILMRWMERYPEATCSITHGFPLARISGWRSHHAARSHLGTIPKSQSQLGSMLPVRIGDIFDYPYQEVWHTLEAMVEHIGADHLLWGTDMPFQNRFCTYRQSRHWIERYCSFLTPDDLAMIMGGTVARILGL